LNATAGLAQCWAPAVEGGSVNRRPFKIPALRQLREHERLRIQARLKTLNEAQAGASPEPSEPATREIRRDQLEVESDLPHSTAAPPPSLPHITGVHASLCRLDGTFFADLPCDARGGIIVLGRGQAAAVQLEDPYVHRVHAHMRWDPAAKVHVIAHGGGENGTYVNRTRITEPVQLYSGARIRVGRSEFIYRLT
jgi:hypothetical protein